MEELFEPNIMLNISDNTICRICLCTVKSGENFLFINDYAKSASFENMLINKMIEMSISEIDLEICDSPIICTTCYRLLINTYIFKSKCFQTEQKIYFYMEKNGLKIGDKIDLKSVMESTINLNTTQNSDNILPTNNQSKEDSLICVTNSDDTDADDQLGNNSSGPLHPRRTHTCDRCEYKAYRYDLLKKHLKKCNGEKLKEMFKCDKCTYSTCRKRNLKRHKMTHGGDRPYTCGICNKGFTEKSHIKSHMYKHTGMPLPYKCGEEDCVSSFARKCDLNAHILKHVKYKPYTCPICNKSFLTEEQFTKHSKRHSKNENLKIRKTKIKKSEVEK